RPHRATPWEVPGGWATREHGNTGGTLLRITTSGRARRATTERRTRHHREDAMRIALTSVPANGHINPTLPMVRERTQRGHSVLYATNERMRETVEAAGAELVPLPGEMPTNPRELTPEQRAQQFLNTA